MQIVGRPLAGSHPVCGQHHLSHPLPDRQHRVGLVVAVLSLALGESAQGPDKVHAQGWLDAYRFWTKVFALTFALGVVSGITMSFQFGTN
jgi:hypothetical protein